MTLDVEDLKREVSEIRWFHSIDLGHGVVTPGVDRSRSRLKLLQLPETLEGQSVLDIGTWNGFYAFAAEQRGATRVLATDSAVWREPGFGRAGFDLARRVLDSKVEGQELDVLDLSPETVGYFDLVLFLGVLYHVRDLLGTLERVAAVTRRQLILETAVDMMWCRRPAAALYPGAELKGDGSNWWGPNVAATKAMLLDVGFSEVQVIWTTSIPGRIARAAKARTQGWSAFDTLQQGRAILHAFK